MRCEEVLLRVETCAFQALSAVDVDSIERHLDEGCRSCGSTHREALNIRRVTDAIAARSASPDGDSGKARIRRRAGWLRLVAFFVLAAVAAFLALQALRIARYSYERKFVRRLEKAVFLYRLDEGHFPPFDRPLARSLAVAPHGPYLDLSRERVDGEGRFLDAWGNSYIYSSPGIHNPRLFDLWSYGKNRRDDGGRVDDVNNWNEVEFGPLPDGGLPGN